MSWPRTSGDPDRRTLAPILPSSAVGHLCRWPGLSRQSCLGLTWCDLRATGHQRGELASFTPSPEGVEPPQPATSCHPPDVWVRRAGKILLASPPSFARSRREPLFLSPSKRATGWGQTRGPDESEGSGRRLARHSCPAAPGLGRGGGGSHARPLSLQACPASRQEAFSGWDASEKRSLQGLLGSLLWS